MGSDSCGGHHNIGDLTLEYRVRTGDDAGVRPAIVVHSIGRRFFDAVSEVNPASLEAAIDSSRARPQ